MNDRAASSWFLLFFSENRLGSSVRQVVFFSSSSFRKVFCMRNPHAGEAGDFLSGSTVIIIIIIIHQGGFEGLQHGTAWHGMT